MDYRSNDVKRIKRVYWLALLFAILIVLASGILAACVPSGGDEPSAERPTALPPCVNNPLADGETALSFLPVDPAEVEIDILSKEEAIIAAQMDDASTRQATCVAAELGTLHNTDREALSNVHGQLVWYLGYEGIISYASGEPGVSYPPPGVSHEYYIVIDAVTGERLFSATYR
jgi:hypothetical protein